MGTDLHNALRSLCFNSAWKYAVFWKLKYRARMVLTWEDAYYDNYEQHDSLESNNFSGRLENLLGRNSEHDQLGMAVAKMSYHVYSLGEGIVGQVAAAGKHQWVFADNFLTNSFPSYEFSDGWQSQFSAGIMTIVVVAVVPYGVVQLGSLNKVLEDLKLVGHIRDVFLTLQDSSFGHSLKGSYCLNAMVEAVDKHESLESLIRGADESEKLSQLRSNVSYLENQNQMMMNLISNQICERESNFWKDQNGAATHVLPSFHSAADNMNSCGFPSSSDTANLPMHLLDSSVCDGAETDRVTCYLNGVLKEPESSSSIMNKDLGSKVEYEAQTSDYDSPSTCMMFSAGYELHEALGPAFLKRYMYFDHEQQKTEARNIIQMPEGISSSEMIFDTGSENLLEAVVSKSCHSGSDVISEKSVCRSVQSLLTTEEQPEPPIRSQAIFNPAGCSSNHSFVKEYTQECSNSTEFCAALSSRGFSSTCFSTCSERLDRHSEPAKNKKRAKPGESCRPRPRDRQLIQDRIKELRELVPNGSKCSIDSLLERTIKHMLFLESITKHADKLNKCAESKIPQKGPGTPNHDHGSSWAVEVGGHLKVSSIVVENLNKSGQMLVEMLCGECSHFLEIAEAIRGLGLTILKGVTEMLGDKTWMCFVVEGQNNRIMHRMDILWSLVQVLQPKTTD